MASEDLDDLTKVRKQSEEGMSVGPKITKDSSKGIDQIEEQIQKLSQYLTTTMQMVAQIKSSISEFISSKDSELLTELPRQSTTSLDILSKSYNLLDRIKNTYTETNRDKEQLMFNLNSQKLEMNKLADYEQQLAEENYELVNRLGLFEQELRAMEDKVANAERIKEEAVINTEQLSSLLVDKAKEIQNLTKEKNDLNIFCKNLEQNIKLLEDLADNQKEDLLKDKQLTSNLEESNNQLQIYKEGF
jgi:chromosome segregation ATPase